MRFERSAGSFSPAAWLSSQQQPDFFSGIFASPYLCELLFCWFGVYMRAPMPEFRRKNIRFSAKRYIGRQLYFVTLCFHNRRRLGSDARIAHWLVGELRKSAANCGFLVHAYCVMPDHLHILAGGALETSNLLKFIMSFKQNTSAKFVRTAHRRLWQFKYYDHILRGRDSAEAVAWYIWLNPVRKGLSASPTIYPFLGSFTEMGACILKGCAVAEWIPPRKPSPLEILKMPG